MIDLIMALALNDNSFNKSILCPDHKFNVAKYHGHLIVSYDEQVCPCDCGFEVLERDLPYFEAVRRMAGANKPSKINSQPQWN